MPSAPEIRRHLEEARLDQAEAIARASAAIAEAPAWFRPGLEPADLTPAQAGAAGRLEALSDEVTRRRTGLDRLDAGLARLDFHAGKLAEAEAAAIEWFNGLSSGAQLRRELVRDPANELRELGGGIDSRLAAALVRYRKTRPDSRIESLQELRRVRGVDDAILADLWWTGFELWQGRFRPPRARPTIGVLLPVRLETRFDPPAGAGT
jgi:hypothetical protein